MAARRFWSLASEYVHVPTKLVRSFQFTQRSDQRNSRGTPRPSEVGLSRSHRHQHGCLPHWSVAVVVGDRQQVLDGLPNVLVLHRTASLQVTTVFRGHCHCRVCPETIGRSTSSHCQMQVMWLTGRPRFRGFCSESVDISSNALASIRTQSRGLLHVFWEWIPVGWVWSLPPLEFTPL